MFIQNTPAAKLWYRYRKTRSLEYHQALVEHYTPVVQMQTAHWAYGGELHPAPVDTTQESSYDKLSEPAQEPFFLPFVPPLPAGAMPEHIPTL
jgi:hypothetical protein